MRGQILSRNLDINPIAQEQHGSLSEYLTGVEAYLAEKQAQMMQEAQGKRGTPITSGETCDEESDSSCKQCGPPKRNTATGAK